MLAQADNNDMDAPSKQGLKERWRTRQCIPSEFKRFSRRAYPRTPPPRNFLALPAQETKYTSAFCIISSKYLTLWRLSDLRGLDDFQNHDYSSMKDFEIANNGINQQSYNSIQIIFTSSSFAYPAQKTQNSQVMATRRSQ